MSDGFEDSLIPIFLPGGEGDPPWLINSYSGGNTAQSLAASISNEIAKFPYDPQAEDNAALYTYDLSGGGATSEFMLEVVLFDNDEDFPAFGRFVPVVFMADNPSDLGDQVNRYMSETLPALLDEFGVALVMSSTAIAGAGPVYCWTGLVFIDNGEEAESLSKLNLPKAARFVRSRRASPPVETNDDDQPTEPVETNDDQPTEPVETNDDQPTEPVEPTTPII